MPNFRHSFFTFVVGSLLASPAFSFDLPQRESSPFTNHLHVIADYTELDQASSVFIARGNVEISVEGQDSLLEADDVCLDLNAETVDAKGNVRISRHASVTTGSRFKFKIYSDEYLITDPIPKPIASRLTMRLQSNAPYLVSDIIVEGNRLISSDRILQLIKTKRGDVFDRDKVALDLKRIRDLGFFEEYSLSCKPELAEHGVLLKFRLLENLPISEFKVTGNSVLKTSKMISQDFFVEQLGKPANKAMLARSLSALEAAYRSLGYPYARVTAANQNYDGVVNLVVSEGCMDSQPAVNAEHESAKIKFASPRAASSDVSSLSTHPTRLPPPWTIADFVPVNVPFPKRFYYSSADQMSRRVSRPLTRKSIGYGISSPPKELLPPLLLPNEYKPHPHEDVAKFF